MNCIVRRMAASGVTAIVMIAGLAAPAAAQWFQGAGYLAAGMSTTATGDLDDALGADGYQKFGGSAANVSLGAYMTVARRVMLGAEWTGIIKDPREHQGRSVWLGGGHGTLGVGYGFDLSPRLRVYPRLGIGVGGLGVTFESAEDTVAFDDALANPDAEADVSRGFHPSLTREHALFDIGAGLEFMPARSGRGAMIGVRLGYALAGSESDWELNKRPVRGGPSASVGGPYIRFMFGAAARR